MTDQYAVFGNPIKHSKSPQIHAKFAELTGQNIHYDKKLADIDGFSAAASAFLQANGQGMNITVPFKLDAYQFADQLSKRARQAGAVNTLILQEDGTVTGDNTDGIGMLADITDNLGWQLNNKKILVLGAGGAVRGILGPLLEHNPRVVVIANRTVEKAQQLATAFSRSGELLGIGYQDLAGLQFDVVINGTSASLAGDLPPLPASLLADKACCYDMMYGKEPTVFMRWASEHGAAQIADGLGMLVEQAAESFRLWRGVKPPTQEVMAELRGTL
jgi:shikimate dehydrogenase